MNQRPPKYKTLGQKYMAKEKPQDRLKRQVGAGFRAMADAPMLQVTFANGEAGINDKEAKLPPPVFNPDDEKLSEFRGAADKVAIEYRYHNPRIHNRTRPDGEEAGAIFDALEDARVEAVGSEYLLGVKRDLTAELEKNYRRLGLERADQNSMETGVEVIKCMAREHFGQLPIPPSAQAVYALKHAQLAAKFQNMLTELSQYQHNQKLFAEKAHQLIIDALYQPTEQDETSEQSQESEENQPDSQPPQEQTEDEPTPEDSQEQNPQTQRSEKEQTDDDSDDADDMEEEDPDAEKLPTDPGDSYSQMDKRQRPEHDLSNIPKEPFYNIYTKNFDEEIPASNLVENDSELDKYRRQLDDQMGDLSSIIAKLANRLQRKLMAEQMRSWDFDLEDGQLDTRRLTRIIIDPTQSLAYKLERETKFKDTIITLLIDNSGSMRGRPISIAAISTDILTRTLERCGLKVEILGFTTSRWKGGKSREKWLQDGKPSGPGRLNDLRHIIYKSAQTPYRKAKNHISLMLKDGLLKENIDGEALMWAHNRLKNRSEDRKILMVISDGAPVDDSTLSVNEANYLERHLRDVIEYIEATSPVELCAIGIGHDVRRYYKRAVMINDVEHLASTMMGQLEQLFDL